MGEGSGDIIIKGGSVEVSFSDTLYPKKGGDPGTHENRDRKITRIVVTDDKGGEVFNSGDHPGGLKWEVRVSTK